MELLRCVSLMTVLVLYTFTLHIEAIVADGPTEALISSICIETEDYVLCMKIIHERLKTPTATLEDLIDLIFHTALDYASDTYVFIGHILRQRPGPKETNSLNTCLTVYDREITSFLEIQYRFSIGDYERMIIDILYTPVILKICTTDFLVPPYKENPLTEKNRVMRLLITMSTVSGYMVINGKASLLSSVVSAPFYNNKGEY